MDRKLAPVKPQDGRIYKLPKDLYPINGNNSIAKEAQAQFDLILSFERLIGGGGNWLIPLDS